MKFWKMHGAGNDFIVADAIGQKISAPDELARRICERRFGVGADGLILMEKSAIADARMRIFNSDGSEPEMCGNGIRCAAKFLYDGGFCRKESVDIETLAGVKRILLHVRDGKAESVTVDMGEPVMEAEKIPVNAPSNQPRLSLFGREVNFFCVSMGNPHAVTFDLYPDEADFLRMGGLVEKHPLFPARTNVEFCRVEDRENIHVKVWERGDGPTLACGTGSCAVLAAAVRLGLAERSAKLHLPGGTLHDQWLENNHILMTGPAETVFVGEIE